MARHIATLMLGLALTFAASRIVSAQSTLPRSVQFRPFTFQNPTFRGFSFRGQQAAPQPSSGVRFTGIRFPGFTGTLKPTQVAANHHPRDAASAVESSPRNRPAVDVSDTTKVRNDFNEPAGANRLADREATSSASRRGLRGPYEIAQRYRMAHPGVEPPVISARAEILKSAAAQRSDREKLANRAPPNTVTARARDNERAAAARRTAQQGPPPRRR